MPENPNFLHGAYGVVNTEALPDSSRGKSRQAFVYIGTAPVGQIAGGDKNVNKPALVNNMAEARRLFGYSDDWAKYTLCEAMHAHFDLKGVGPLVLINVLDPAVNKDADATTVSLTPANGRLTVAGAEDIILDTLTITKGESTVLVAGTDYTAAYDYARKAIIATEITGGAGFGTSALSVSYKKATPDTVTASQVIGTSDGYGVNTGIQAVRDVYNLTGHIPAYLLAPGFSSVPSVHAALSQNSQKIAKHWNAWIFADIPVMDNTTPITLATAPAWKQNNGYNLPNESVFFPLGKGTDGNVYHLSVLAAANFQELLIRNSGIPYMTYSNTEAAILEDLYFTASTPAAVYTDDIITSCLNSNGINSAAYAGGRWVLWGMFPGNYSDSDEALSNNFDTCLMMLYYLTNDFQHRRTVDVDKPMAVNALKSIVAEEQARVDALLGIGALTYGKVTLDATREARSDVYKGDFRILYNITTMPLAKSLTAVANWTDEGFELYFTAMENV